MSVPILVNSTPNDNARAFQVDRNIELFFSERVIAGSGDIVISNGRDTRTIAVDDSTQIKFLGSRVIINPTEDLITGTTYNIQLASGVITDRKGQAYAGISDGTTLNFTIQVGALLPVELSAIEQSDNNAGFIINGVSASDISGYSVSGAGDVNGDGLADVIIGAYADDSNGSDSGASFVVFGKRDGAAVELSAIENGSGGFVINGVSAFDSSGGSVSGAGDVNDDSLADLIVGASGDDPNGSSSGASFVVFGGAINLNFTTSLEQGPFLIDSTPNDDATSQADANLVLAFNERVIAGSGDIIISNGRDTRTIAVDDSTQVKFLGSRVSINPTEVLTPVEN